MEALQIDLRALLSLSYEIAQKCASFERAKKSQNFSQQIFALFMNLDAKMRMAIICLPFLLALLAYGRNTVVVVLICASLIAAHFTVGSNFNSTNPRDNTSVFFKLVRLHFLAHRICKKHSTEIDAGLASSDFLENEKKFLSAVLANPDSWEDPLIFADLSKRYLFV